METYVITFWYTPKGSYERREQEPITVKSKNGKFKNRASDMLYKKYGNQIKIISCRVI